MTNHKTGQYLAIEPGVELYYEDHGAGQPIVFIPGWTFTTELFIHQATHFSQNRRVVLYDPRSHGRSSVTLHGNNYAQHGSDLARLIQALDLRDVTLVGWSFGCLAIWELVRQQGLQNIKAVVQVDLSPKTLSVNEGYWVEGPLDEIAGAYNGFLSSPQGQRDFVTFYATEVMVQRQLTEQELFWINEQSLKTPYYIAAQLFASGMFSNYMEEARLVDEGLPALYVIAEHWAPTAVAFVQKHFPHMQTAVLGGHMMFWEHAEKFNHILSDFLSSV